MKYLFALLLLISGCSSTLIGVNRSTGERIIIMADPLHFGYDELTTTIDGENYKGKLVGTNDSTVTVNGHNYEISGSKSRSVLFGDKGHTMRCDMSNGVGSCDTSDGKEFDVQ